nr:autoinducer binding domain-containing protein [Rhizobium sp. P44RR-XXIV]
MGKLRIRSGFQNLVREVQNALKVDDALRILEAAYGIDFATYHLALTVADVVDTPYVRTTYRDAWIARYLLRGYVKVDPIVREGLIRQMPFDWREVEVPQAAHDFLLDAQEHGVGANGYSIPIVDKKRRALFSLNSRKSAGEWSKLVETYSDEWLDLSFLIHRKAVFELHGEHDPVPQLGRREKECLYWSALGKTNDEIAEILGLSMQRMCIDEDAIDRDFPGMRADSAFCLLLLALCEAALANGINTMISNYEPHMRRVYQKAGAELDELGRSDGYGRHPVCCGAFEVSHRVLGVMRAKLQVDGPLYHRPAFPSRVPLRRRCNSPDQMNWKFSWPNTFPKRLPGSQIPTGSQRRSADL